jgi:anaerobic magnesium-protoporphyrin IX monomethyl ester cyclase
MNITRLPPLTIALLSAILEKANFNVDVIDFDLLFNHSREPIDFFLNNAIECVENKNPDVICLTCMTAQFPFVALFSKQYKKRHPETKIITGGWMPTLNPELFFKVADCDIVVRGEGDKTLPQLLKCITHDAWSINGISYQHKNTQQIIHTPNSIPLSETELDDLPFPKYDLLPPLSTYQPEFRNYAFVVQASRGCINHQCIFCWNSTSNCINNWRARSPSNIITEIRHLVDNYNGFNFTFADDSFGAQPDWLTKFIFLMQKEFKPHEIEYGCSMRIDTGNTKSLKDLYATGLRTVFYGIESGSPRLWKVLRKNYPANVNRNYIIDKVKNAIDLGITPKCSFIIGLPTETENDLEKTISLCNELNTMGAIFSFQLLVPNEGTELFTLYESSIELFNVYQELGFFDSFWPNLRRVFRNRFREFFPFLPDNKWLKPEIPLNSFKKKYSVLNTMTYNEVKPFF